MNSLYYLRTTAKLLQVSLISEYLNNQKVLVFSTTGNTSSNSAPTTLSLLDIKMFCLLCLHRPTICTTLFAMPRWVLEEIIKYSSLVYQIHLVGNSNRSGQFPWPLGHRATTHVLDRCLKSQWYRQLHICRFSYFKQIFPVRQGHCKIATPPNGVIVCSFN